MGIPGIDVLIYDVLIAIRAVFFESTPQRSGGGRLSIVGKTTGNIFVRTCALSLLMSLVEHATLYPEVELYLFEETVSVPFDSGIYTSTRPRAPWVFQMNLCFKYFAY